MSILTKIKNRTKWAISYPINWFYKTFYQEPVVKGIEDTIVEIIKNNCSISRFGDGEFDIIFGKDIPFQKYDAKLAEKMRNILFTNDDYFLVGLPNAFGSLDMYNNAAQIYYKNYMRNNRKKCYKCLNRKNKIYYCAGMTRPYMDLEDKTPSEKYFNLLKQIWKDKKVVIIEGEKSRLGIGNDLFNGCTEIKRILGPAKNAFEFYDDLLQEVKKFDKDYLILLALGPTATALAYDIYKMGYRALDIGHVDIEYEWFKMGVTTKVPVKNKYTNEAGALGGQNVGESDDSVYKSQVFSKIGC